MRDVRRIGIIIYLIIKIWYKYPDMRFGQLIDNLYYQYAISTGVHPHPKDYFYVEDDDFMKWLVTFKGWF